MIPNNNKNETKIIKKAINMMAFFCSLIVQVISFGMCLGQ